MMFRSIRSRLVLSFAGIALVAAVALGAVLLIILQKYYSNLELEYLNENAKAVSGFVSAMTSENVPHDEVQSQIENLAFLSQTRIQVFGQEGQLLYDSGSPQNINVNLGTIKQMLPLQLNGTPPDGMVSVIPKGNALFLSSSATGPSLSTATLDHSDPNGKVIIYRSFQAGGSLFGFSLNSGIASQDIRSNLSVAVPSKNGGVTLSEGPAYGRDILGNVAWGWALASAIAVLLSAAMGWFISRRISAPVLALTEVTTRMAQGDLSGRADVESRDEFGQLAQSFNEMADQVETTVTTLRRFVSDAAHELRTPLTALRANLDLALEEKNTASRKVFVERAQQMVKRLEELNTNLLDLSRLEANGYFSHVEIIDITVLLRQRNEVYASQAEQAGLEYDAELPVTPLVVRVDASQITRAIDNLVDNACKFTPQGGIVRVILSEEAGQVIISIVDTGIGIPADELGQLFNRFHRSRNTMSYPGSGLGLAIVKAIVASCDGQVEVQSAGEGKGSKFSISLPRLFPP